MFLAFIRIHSLVIESETIVKARERDQEDEELIMMQMELESEAAVMKADLLDEQLFEQKYKRGCEGEHDGVECDLSDFLLLRKQADMTEQTNIGHEFYRITILTLILSGIFRLPRGHARLEKCVDDMVIQGARCSKSRYLQPMIKIDQTHDVAPGTEIGLVWPYIVGVGTRGQIDFS